MTNCSRSDFTNDNCGLCFCLYIDELFRTTNFNIKIDFDFFSTELKDYFYKNRYSKININLFYDSLKHIESINSDKSRCLTVLVINNVFELIILFFETQIRIFYNFFFKLSVDVFFTNCERKNFLTDCFNFVLNFMKYCLKNMKISMFEEIFFNKLERILNEKYLKINVSISKRTKIVHFGLDKALHDFEDYLHVIKDFQNFFLRNIEKYDYEFFNPQLVNSIKWKFDYIIFRMKRNSCST